MMSASNQTQCMPQVLQLNNERFLVPELAFSPSDIGLKQGGIAQQAGPRPCILSQPGMQQLTGRVQGSDKAGALVRNHC